MIRALIETRGMQNETQNKQLCHIQSGSITNTEGGDRQKPTLQTH